MDMFFYDAAVKPFCFDLNVGLFGNFFFNTLSWANTNIGVATGQGPKAVEFSWTNRI